MYKYIRNTNYTTYIDKYYPYDDFKIIKDTFGDLTPK